MATDTKRRTGTHPPLINHRLNINLTWFVRALQYFPTSDPVRLKLACRAAQGGAYYADISPHPHERVSRRENRWMIRGKGSRAVARVA